MISAWNIAILNEGDWQNGLLRFLSLWIRDKVPKQHPICSYWFISVSNRKNEAFLKTTITTDSFYPRYQTDGSISPLEAFT